MSELGSLISTLFKTLNLELFGLKNKIRNKLNSHFKILNDKSEFIKRLEERLEACTKELHSIDNRVLCQKDLDKINKLVDELKNGEILTLKSKIETLETTIESKTEQIDKLKKNLINEIKKTI